VRPVSSLTQCFVEIFFGINPAGDQKPMKGLVSSFLWLFIRASARVADGRLASVSQISAG
jgi:hypothetical protein